ncbi:MAG: shikimate dehydrogenase [Proteobacteria bacterium]|jgi:shikimate dehydrogenase|nr:shikimate dehydrogenase [Pseudomonadota bacterium]
MTADLYCVMGNPVEHSKSPWIHARFAELTGQALQYGRRLVPLDGFAQSVAAFRAEGGRGCNITVPFKFEAGALPGLRMTPRAALAQACNTLRFDGGAIFADNTDGRGLVDDITRNAGVALAGKRLLLIGAGGAAAGVLGPLIEVRPAHITVTNRTVAKAQALVQRHAAWAAQHGVQLAAHELQAVGGPYDVVINGTASSLAGAGIPVPASVLAPGTLAVDMMYGPAADAFMQWATQHGAVARDGLGMLVEQAAESFAVWRGVRPPSAQVLDELRRTLSAP